MNNKKKILIPVLCVLMMIIGGLATWAYLTSQDSAVNTFTVGNVAITLDELDTDNDDYTDDNKPYTEDPYKDTVRDKSNKYHLIPGQTYVKDPAIHVDPNSENCFLYVTVDNQIAPLEASANTIAAQMEAKGWLPLGVKYQKDQTHEELDVYYFCSVAKAGQNVPVFESFTVDGSKVKNVQGTRVEGEVYIEDYANSNIIVTGFAIQAAGFNNSAENLDTGNIPATQADALAAWNAANGQFK